VSIPLDPLDILQIALVAEKRDCVISTRIPWKEMINEKLSKGKCGMDRRGDKRDDVRRF
jgi:hypothetical protein